MPPKSAAVKVEPSVPVQRHAHVRPPKPDDTPLKQQRLPHIWAEHSPPTVILCLLFVAIVFIPIGAAVIVGSNSVWELDLRYDHIQSCTYANNQGIQTISAEIVNGTAATAATGATGETTIDVSSTQGCRTRLSFTLDKGISGPVYMYYRLKNFYQNYRLYAESRDDTQLMGESVTLSYIEYCDPWDSAGNYRGIGDRSTDPATSGAPTYGSMMYAPCGAIAWSMFNDSISLYSVADENWAGGATTSTSTAPLPNATTTVVCAGAGFAADGTVTDPANTNCQKKDIAIWNARNTQFKAPMGGDLVWTGEGRSTATDLYLRNGWYADEVGHKLPIQTDEDFMVWTTLATLSDFRKLYRIINADLQPGTYVIEVDEYFDSASFGGEKHVVLATRSWIGAKNHVLGGLFLGLGIWSFVIAVAFVVQYLIKSRK